MLTLLWNLSAAIRGYLRFYMPTNRAVDWLRSSRGLKWAIPAAVVITSAYLGLTALAILLAGRPGLGWLNVLVLLFFWNAVKFAWMAVLAPVIWLSGRRETTPGNGQPGGQGRAERVHRLAARCHARTPAPGPGSTP